MKTVKLGNTGIIANKNGFGALPIQRIDTDSAVKLIHMALDGGINFFDTARAYSDSEEKLGIALEGVDRHKYYIATKTASKTGKEVLADLETSLRLLKTEYIDIYQLHCAPKCFRPGDADGVYDAVLQAKEQGKIKHIGITAHLFHVAQEAIESGLYETLQYPFAYISSEKEIALVKKCEEAGMGFLGMKGLAGGLLTNSKLCYWFACQHEAALPLWGIQRETELAEFLSYQDNMPEMDDAMKADYETDLKELAGDFCRGCGYCMPCPQNVDIPAAFSAYNHKYSEGSISALQEYFMCTALRKDYSGVANCIECGKCELHCPQHIEIKKELKNAKRHLETPVYKLGRWLVKRLKAY